MAKYLLLMCVFLVPTLSHCSGIEDSNFSMVYKGKVYTNKIEYEAALKQNCLEFMNSEIASERNTNILYALRQLPKTSLTPIDRDRFKGETGIAEKQ